MRTGKSVTQYFESDKRNFRVLFRSDDFIHPIGLAHDGRYDWWVRSARELRELANLASEVADYIEQESKDG